MDPSPPKHSVLGGKGKWPRDAGSAYVLHELSFFCANGSGPRHCTLLCTSVPPLVLSSPPAIFSLDPGVSSINHPSEVFGTLPANSVYHSHGPGHCYLECYLVGHVHFSYTHCPKFLEVRNCAFPYSSPAQNTIPHCIRHSEAGHWMICILWNRVYAH